MQVTVLDVGRMNYAAALELQLQTHERVVSGELEAAVILVEHDPVITVSQRKSASQNLLANPQQLKKLGIEVHETDRGGDITYHGPGQLVAYPMVRLADLKLHVGGYMRMLEEVVIATLGHFQVKGQTESGATGVWVELQQGADHHHSGQLPGVGPCPQPTTAKICAMGVRVKRNVSLHGLALNVTTNLSHFQTIVPCGLVGRPVTSLQQVLGDDACPAMKIVKEKLVEELNAAMIKRAS